MIAARMGTAPRAIELMHLPDELIDRVFKQLSSVRDLGRAGCVCRAWRAGDSPVARVLRRRIEAHGGAVSAALPPVAADSMTPMTHRLCLLDSIGATQAVSGIMSLQYVSAAVDAHGSLLVWGKLESYSNEDEPIFSCSTPTVVQTVRIECVSVGSAHILALTDAGEVLSFGLRGDGQLGHGDRADQRVPKVIEALRGMRVVAIAAGYDLSMVLTDEGKVLSFGWGGHGPLGHGDVAHQLVPKVIEALRGRRVVAIAAGDCHSMVLTDEGSVLSFGAGVYGNLGHAHEPHYEVNQFVPKVIAALQAFRR